MTLLLTIEVLCQTLVGLKLELLGLTPSTLHLFIFLLFLFLKEITTTQRRSSHYIHHLLMELVIFLKSL